MLIRRGKCQVIPVFYSRLAGKGTTRDIPTAATVDRTARRRFEERPIAALCGHSPPDFRSYLLGGLL
jgi:hypothetical protein